MPNRNFDRGSFASYSDSVPQPVLTYCADDATVVVMPEPLLTTDGYLRTAQTVLPQELVFGYVRDAPAPTADHQDAVGAVYTCFRRHLESTGAGRAWLSPLDVVLDRDRALVVQPDVIVVMNDRLPIVTDRVWGGPDLVVEVLSPQPRIGKLDERIAWFAAYGVRECWLVRQFAREIEVISFADGATAARRSFSPHEPVASGVLPQLHVSAASILG